VTGYSNLVRASDLIGRLCLRLRRGDELPDGALGGAIDSYCEKLVEESLRGFLVELATNEYRRS
jgi:hypothetical protein